jgi:hypothetical protein
MAGEFPFPLLVAHKPEWRTYRYYNGPSGPRRVARIGANAYDNDTCVDADGVQQSNHWPIPGVHEGFRAGGVPLRARLSSLTSAAVARLRADRGRTRIPTCAEQLQSGKEHGVTPCFEIKTWSEAGLQRLESDAGRIGVPLVIMAQPQHEDALRFGHSIGCVTVLLTRGVVPAEWADFLTYAKGSAEACARIPSVARLGTGPRNATRFGAGCNTANIRAVRRATSGL